MTVADTPLGRATIALGFIFPVIDGVLVALRFYTRWHQEALFRTDDWLCIPAWIFQTATCATVLAGMFLGAFEEAQLYEPTPVVTDQARTIAQITGSLILLWSTGNALVKLAILFFYRRIFISRTARVATAILITASVLWWILSILGGILYCGRHVKENFLGGWAVCSEWGFKMQLGVYLFDIMIDLSLLILPIPLIWKLHLRTPRKIAVSFVFVIGGVAFFAGLALFAFYTFQFANLHNPEATRFISSSTEFLVSALLYIVEIGVGLITCNIPTISFTAARSVPRFFHRSLSLSWLGIKRSTTAVSSRVGGGGDSSKIFSAKNKKDSPRHVRDPDESLMMDTIVATRGGGVVGQSGLHQHQKNNKSEGGGTTTSYEDLLDDDGHDHKQGHSNPPSSSIPISVEESFEDAFTVPSMPGNETARSRAEGYHIDHIVEKRAT